MFGNPNCIIYDGNMQQLDRLIRSLPDDVVLGECVLVTPSKSLFIPSADPEIVRSAITDDESLHTTQFRYRKSGPKKGATFANARDLREHIMARRKRVTMSRLPGPEGAKLQKQAQIEVIGLDAHNHEHLPQLIMDKAGEINSTNFTKQIDYELELEFGEWRPLVRGGRWTGRILVLCPENIDLGKFFCSVQGRSICINGVHKTLAVTAPVHNSLAADVFNSLQQNT